jgi:hypothetical protein
MADLMVPCEKFRNFDFFHGFWIEMIENLIMADLVSQIEGAHTFFLRKYLSLIALS